MSKMLEETRQQPEALANTLQEAGAMESTSGARQKADQGGGRGPGGPHGCVTVLGISRFKRATASLRSRLGCDCC
jgi:hypothetical protein